MKYSLFALIAIFICACTDYQGDWEDKYGSKFAAAPEEDTESFDSTEDFPNCTIKKEGLVVKVKGEEVLNVCHEKKWYYGISVVKTEDDLPICSDKRQGFQAYLEEPKTIVQCNNGRWVSPEDVEEDTEEDAEEFDF